MDVFTQGLIGAASAQSVAKPDQLRKAGVIGFLSGLLADADVLIRSGSDPMLTLEYHRHFSHALLFIPVGALIACLLLWPFFRKHLDLKQLYIYCFAGYLFSGFIDACTSYGTYLFWPFLDERIAWHIISIVDPIFTLVVLAAIVLAFKLRKRNLARAGLFLAGCYLLLGVFQLQRAEQAVIELAEKRNHVIEKQIVKPTLGNLLLWRSVYLADGYFYIDAVRAGTATRIYQGDRIRRFQFDMLDKLPNSNSVLFDDIQRFDHFSDGYVAFHPERPDTLGDVRYAMSPLKITPLWGIEMNLAEPDRHVNYAFYRTTSKASRQQFINMLLNRDI